MQWETIRTTVDEVSAFLEPQRLTKQYDGDVCLVCVLADGKEHDLFIPRNLFEIMDGTKRPEPEYLVDVKFKDHDNNNWVVIDILGDEIHTLASCKPNDYIEDKSDLWRYRKWSSVDVFKREFLGWYVLVCDQLDIQRDFLAKEAEERFEQID